MQFVYIIYDEFKLKIIFTLCIHVCVCECFAKIITQVVFLYITPTT